MDNKMLTISQIAKEANVSRMTVYRWVNSGKLNSFKFGGGTLRISPEDWENFKASAQSNIEVINHEEQ